MTKKPLQPSTLPKPPNFSQGIEATGRMVFISGLVSIDAQGTTIAPGDIEGQTRHIFNNMESILKEAGGNRDNIVKMNVFLTDMKNFPGMSKVRSEFFKAPFPASAAVQAQLLKPEWLVEIDAVAVL